MSSTEAIVVSGRALAETRSAASANTKPTKPKRPSSMPSPSRPGLRVVKTMAKPSIVRPSMSQRAMAYPHATNDCEGCQASRKTAGCAAAGRRIDADRGDRVRRGAAGGWMESLSQLALAGGLAWASGIRLYVTILVVGLLGRYGYL